MKIAPYGSWKSPITSDLIVAGTVSLSEITFDGDDIYWLEGRPSEGGRNVVVRRAPDGNVSDLTPAPFNARTSVHEYGGGSFLPVDGKIYFSNFSDQRLYFQTTTQEPQPLTPPVDLRFADFVFDRARNRLICVREDHTMTGREAVNTIVAISLGNISESGSASKKFTPGEVLVSGSDFYSSPRLSPDGKRLAWLQWSHPNLPWDGTELWVGEFGDDGLINQKEKVAGGADESIFQPEWSPEGSLHFISDRTNWWNLYRWDGKVIENLLPKDVEFGVPQWVFGLSTYAFVSENQLICTFNDEGRWFLAVLHTRTKELNLMNQPFTEIRYVRTTPTHAVFWAGWSTEPSAIVHLDLMTGIQTILRRSSNIQIDPEYISVPQAIEFPTEKGLKAYAFYYPPDNQDYAAPPGAKPPLLVKIHGGPTSAATPILVLGIQYWTSRGFAVVDVNYGGSTGYGREYRTRLNGQWGVVDVDDCVNAARHLVTLGWVDPDHLAIDGGSAGGYTTLCALTFHDVFKAGASYFGISDLKVMDEDTHKFESRYSHSLLGPLDTREKIYRERSPIHYIDRLTCPLILFQGLEDKIVLPNQAQMMFDAARKKGLPVAYVPFEGEQHGFRRAENIKRALDAELYFYGKVFGFELADPIEPVKIENL